jgi:hypothetical protein
MMSSATTNAQGSVSFVTAVETVVASMSSSSSLAEDVTSLETVFATATATGNSSAAAASNKSEESSGGLGTGPIIGISVAGGVVVLAISLFILWKLKQKYQVARVEQARRVIYDELAFAGQTYRWTWI